MNLNLGPDKAKRLNSVQKPIDDTFLYSDITWGFEVSEGWRPADPFLPNRFCPTVRVVKTKSYHRKGIVIPRGSILAAVPALSQNYYWRTSTSNAIVPGSGETLSGEVALGIGYDGNVLSADVEDMIEGYDNIRLAGVLANGGTTVKDKYAAYDVERGRVGVNGSLVTVSDEFTRSANIPIGVVTEDTYVWDAGNKLNYNEISWTPFRSYMTDYFVEMPYCADESMYNMDVSLSTGTQTMGIGYAAAWALGMPFMTAAALGDMVLGNFVMPDYNGKYKTQYTGTQLSSGNYSVNETTQTVGKLNSFTNKFPQDLEGLVETFHTSQVGGTATYGIFYNLFVFMRAILAANIGSEPTYNDYRDALDSAKFGIARINLHVA